MSLEPLLTHGMLGFSDPMLRVYDKIEQVGPTSATVLIQGETGTGKELVAEAIYKLGKASGREGNYVKINCAAIPKDIAESVLFGHSRGAFTGAHEDRTGLLLLAHNGMILLDEIEAMSPYLQPKLLRALEEKEVRHVGGSKTYPLDVRVIASTNEDLWYAAQEGKFRKDLFYRLNIFTINLPPLRDRKEDIPLLTKYFFKKYCDTYKAESLELNTDALQALSSYPWPGNVRELEATIQRAVLSRRDKPGLITGAGIEFTQNNTTAQVPINSKIATLLEEYLRKGVDAGEVLDVFLHGTSHQIDDNVIRTRIEVYSGNKSASAKSLGLSLRKVRQVSNQRS